MGDVEELKTYRAELRQFMTKINRLDIHKIVITKSNALNSGSSTMNPIFEMNVLHHLQTVENDQLVLQSYLDWLEKGEFTTPLDFIQGFPGFESMRVKSEFERNPTLDMKTDYICDGCGSSSVVIKSQTKRSLDEGDVITSQCMTQGCNSTTASNKLFK